MRRRRRLLIIMGLLGAFLIGRQWVDAYVGQRVARTLQEAGYRDVTVSGVRVGLEETLMGPLVCSDPARLSLQSLRVAYDPLVVFREHRVERIEVRGLTAEGPMNMAGGGALPALPDPERLPFREIVLRDVRLRDVIPETHIEVVRGGLRVLLPWTSATVRSAGQLGAAVRFFAGLSVDGSSLHVDGSYLADGRVRCEIIGGASGPLNLCLSQEALMPTIARGLRFSRVGDYNVRWNGRWDAADVRLEIGDAALDVPAGGDAVVRLDWASMVSTARVTRVADGLCAVGVVTVSNLFVESAGATLVGVSGSVPFGREARASDDAAGGRLVIEEVRLGSLTLSGGTVDCEILADRTVRVREVGFAGLGGRGSCPRFDVRPGDSALHVVLQFMDIELGELLALVAPERLEGEGLLSGHLNLDVQMQPDFTVKFGTGYLDSQDVRGWFRLLAPVDPAAFLGDHGPISPDLAARIRKAMLDFQYRDLSVVLNRDDEGHLLARVHTRGRGPGRREPLKFGGLTFNLRGLDGVLGVLFGPARGETPAEGEGAPELRGEKEARAIEKFF